MSDTCSVNTHDVAHLPAISVLDKHILEQELRANSYLNVSTSNGGETDRGLYYCVCPCGTGSRTVNSSSTQKEPALRKCQQEFLYTKHYCGVVSGVSSMNYRSSLCSLVVFVEVFSVTNTEIDIH